MEWDVRIDGRPWQVRCPEVSPGQCDDDDCEGEWVGYGEEADLSYRNADYVAYCPETGETRHYCEPCLLKYGSPKEWGMIE